MFQRRKQVPNMVRPHLLLTNQRVILLHWVSMGARRKALAHLTDEQRAAADTYIGLARLVKDKLVSERLVKRVAIKLGGITREPAPKATRKRTPLTIKLGSKLTANPSLVAQMAQACPKGFRTPSGKAKNWGSTSLVERLMGQQPEFERSKRGARKAREAAETRELVKATQDIRNVPRVYLSPEQKMLRDSLPALPKDQTVGAIKERHAKARGEEADTAEAA